jgi:hypothetical protein
MRPFLASGVRPDAPHRARHAGASLRSFIASIVVDELSVELRGDLVLTLL